ncbi:MAG: hypothetical protein K6G80_11575 [Treponema sp.]|nr:hypothetical protein [Treponema sp.]
MTLTIIHEPTAAEPFLVIDKPAGLPTAPLQPGDDAALTRAMKLFPQIASVTGKKPVEKGLLHRIDTATRGCVLIATTQDAYDKLDSSQKSGSFYKWYKAEVELCQNIQDLLPGFPPSCLPMNKNLWQNDRAFFSLTSRFRPFGPHNAQVRPVTEESGEAALKKSGSTLYTTDVTLTRKEGRMFASCRITAGYRHQVRCHLAWQGFPILGDPLYNPHCKEESELFFSAVRLQFPNPVDGKLVDISLPDTNRQEHV